MSILNKTTKVIGLTGMSGAGKSTACKLFSENGFEIIDCDLICRELVEKGKPCLSEISYEFGGEIINPDGTLNRSLLSEIVFSDNQKRLILNGIMYPYVSYLVIKRLISTDNKYAVLDAPTLFESGINEICDIVVSVVSSYDTLINRIMNRDGINKEAAQKRLMAQQSQRFYEERSDFVIINNEDNKKFSELIKKTILSIKHGREANEHN